MSPLLLVHLAATWALVGLIWTIQLVHYPSFAHVAPDRWAEAHAFHSARITWIVAPLMLTELATGLILALSSVTSGSAAGAATSIANTPSMIGPPVIAFRLGLALIVAIWLATFLLSVPAHNLLSRGYDPGVHRHLVQTNWVRTIAWTLRGLLLLAVLFRRG